MTSKPKHVEVLANADQRPDLGHLEYTFLGLWKIGSFSQYMKTLSLSEFSQANRGEVVM